MAETFAEWQCGSKASVGVFQMIPNWLAKFCATGQHTKCASGALAARTTGSPLSSESASDKAYRVPSSKQISWSIAVYVPTWELRYLFGCWH